MAVTKPIANAADQHRDIGTLATAISVQFVEHYEVQALGIVDDRPIKGALARHQQLEHHEVREEDVRLLGSDALSLLSAFLSRIPRESRRQPMLKPGLCNELLKLASLTIS